MECRGAKLLYRSNVVGHFYGTEYKIWAGFGPVGCTENFGLGRTFEGNFICFRGQKKLYINLE